MATRLVTPDVLHLGNLCGRELIEFWHNYDFSDITMYKKPTAHLRSIVEDRQKEGEMTPWFILTAHQHIFHLIYEGQTWVGCLPGLTDPELAVRGRLRQAHVRVLMDKMHRRATFAGELVRPAVPVFEVFKDGRAIFTIWNPGTLAVTEANQDKPPFHEMTVIISDTQNGSISGRPEILIKFIDYCIWRAKKISEEKGVRVKIHLVINGDFNHGSQVYMAHYGENHLTKLSTIRSQKDFGYNELFPYMIDPEFLHYLVEVKIVTGNHEWDPPIVQLRGQNDLDFLYFGFKPLLGKMFEKGVVDHRIPIYLMGRWRDMGSNDGDPVNWPFSEVNTGGFRLGFQHKFYFKGGDSADPTEILKRWSKRAGKMARSLHAIYQGHLHHREFRMHGTKIVNQLGSFAGVSGYEFVQGFHSTVMGTIVHISQDGFAQEEVPFEFLKNWKCQGPYKKVDELGFLEPPAAKSLEYRSGIRSKYIEWLCDFIHQYPPQLSDKEEIPPSYKDNPVEQFLSEQGA